MWTSSWRSHGCQSSFFNFYYCRFSVFSVILIMVNPLSLISTIVDGDWVDAEVGEVQSSFFNFYYCRWRGTGRGRARQSSFFNFYYCRYHGAEFIRAAVNPLSLISTIVDGIRLPRTPRQVNPLSLISTIVDVVSACRDTVVNPLSLISTIVDKTSSKVKGKAVNPLSLISTIVDAARK